MSKGLDFKRLTNLQPVPWDLKLSEDDLFAKNPGNVLFGCIPLDEVNRDLEDTLAPRLAARGYTRLETCLEHPTPFEERFQIHGYHQESGQTCLLVDVRTHHAELVGDPNLFQGPREHLRPFRALVWEWISQQDPMATFAGGREPLPGQVHPGLGVFRQMTATMLEYVKRTDKEALVAVPEYFHNAVLYSPLFRFYDPTWEGRFQAMQRDLLGQGLARASQAVCRGTVCVEPADGPIWAPSEQVHPLTELLEEHFRSPGYLTRVEATREGHTYRCV